jgi:hypothetical protein
VREAVISASDWKSQVALKVTSPIPKDDVKQRGSENHQQPIKDSVFHGAR